MDFQVIGKVFPRKDGIAKVCGQEVYPSDVVIPNMLYGVTLRSPYPHAEILSIDTSEAEAMGAIVVTPDDVPDVIYNERTVSIPEKTYRDRRVLPRKARHVGEAIVAVAAESEELAFRAMRAIKVEYKVLPPVLDMDKAVEPDAPALYEEIYLGDNKIEVKNNVACDRVIVVGDPEAGFAKADHIVEREYELPRVYHNQMETKTAVCRPEPNGGITVWATTQTIHNVRQLLGHIFNIPLSKVNVKKLAIGGSFGSSIQMNSIIPICVALALKAKRPVKMVSSREDDIYDHTKFPARIKLKVGVKKDGTIVAADMRVLVDIGAHQINAYPLLGCMAGWYASLYKWRDFRYEGKAIYTNKVPACAMQGYGNPQVNFAVESHMDIIAEECGFDPVEFRLKNYIGIGDEFWGQGPTVRSIIKSCGVEEMLRVGSEMIGWSNRRPPQEKTGRYRRGIGMARGFHTSGTGGPKPGEVIDYSSATIKINEDGTVDVMTPVMDLGGGTGEAAVKITAEVLKVPYERVELSPVDTKTTGYDVCTHATRGVYCGCGAVYHVALQVKEKLLEYAGRILEENPGNLDLAYDEAKDATIIHVKGFPQKHITIGEVAKLAQIYSWGTIAATDSLRQKNCPPCFVAHFIEVEVDTLTGIVRIPRAILLSDTGTPINPDMVKGQLIGSLSRGMGYALYEETEYDLQTGKLKCNGFITDNKIPTTCEMPYIDDIQVYFAHTYEPTGPFGAKGIGEAALNSVASAIANAIYNAIGIRFYKTPITPERILEALEGGEKNGN
ncbi:xanthine dehydrogenase family protein molybdopterin-binding subunit [Neomoorella humiferrea]|uniref:Xanthine dehydrogenase molybdenum-binding subunit n=1 Tax=Neomoorella humiferrea TaxID=676965 RepID=A0A2T0ALL6_9FIRM|nr:molybdopterin cofactor-binding domain-containing protein [Moorella humiferrea]PRR69496.1 Xanthine dehydrogenase molybdenum-binding subunit [Moorella humiferrea]